MFQTAIASEWQLSGQSCPEFSALGVNKFSPHTPTLPRNSTKKNHLPKHSQSERRDSKYPILILAGDVEFKDISIQSLIYNGLQRNKFKKEIGFILVQHIHFPTHTNRDQRIVHFTVERSNIKRCANESSTATAHDSVRWVTIKF